MATAAPEAKPEPYLDIDSRCTTDSWVRDCHLPQVYTRCPQTCGVAYPALLAYTGYDYAYGAYPYANAYDYAAYPYADYGLTYDVYGRATRYYKK